MGKKHIEQTSNTLVSYNKYHYHSWGFTLVTFLWQVFVYQRHGQNTANASAHNGHSMLVRTSVQNTEAIGGGWWQIPQEKFGIVELPRSILRRISSSSTMLLGLVQTLWCRCVHSVKSLQYFRSLEHARPHYSEDTDSYTVQLDFNTIYLAPDLQQYIWHRYFSGTLHWWGTVSSCYSTCSSVPHLGYATVVCH